MFKLWTETSGISNRWLQMCGRRSRESQQGGKSVRAAVLITYISAHAVLLLHFTLLGVQAVVGRAAVLLAGRAQAFRRRYRVILQQGEKNKLLPPTHTHTHTDANKRPH